MSYVTIDELEKNLEKYLDEALIGPIFIEKDGKPLIVMISLYEYDNLRQIT